MKTEWNPNTSKWKAALEVGIPITLKGNENILYLGASSGTTVSHISQQTKGIIFAVEKSPQMAIPLIKLAEQNQNIAPIVSDARDTEYVKKQIGTTKIDILFQDIPSADQIHILKEASKIVNNETVILFTLKTQSISQQNPEKTYKEAKKEIEKTFNIVQVKSLEPFHKKHYFFILKKNN